MAQLKRDDTSESPTTPRPHNFPISEQHLQEGDSPKWPAPSSSIRRKDHEHEESYTQHNKKSVIKRVKEKAKKLRQSLSGRKHKRGHSRIPSWDDNEDPEFLGAPMYGSEQAPETSKEIGRQEPGAATPVSEKHVLTSSVKNEAEEETEKPLGLSKIITEAASESPAAANAALPDATHANSPKDADRIVETGSGECSASSDSETRKQETGDQKGKDKGVSMKEYLMHKLEPGEDERALSRAITEAITPRRTPGGPGMVKKVRGIVASLISNEESSQSTTRDTNSSSSLSSIPVSTSVQSAPDEENEGRIPQTN